jgi:hypothetical protein
MSSPDIAVKSDDIKEGSPRPKFIKQSRGVLAAIHDLSLDQNIVLFTPVIPLPLPNATADGASSHRSAGRLADPFEPLGLALSRHHNKIRHVPYVPNIGPTDMHFKFLQFAGSIIVVTCDIIDLASTKRAKFTDQIAFAKAINRTGQGLSQTRQRSLTILLLLVTDKDSVAFKRDDVEQFDVVMQCDRRQGDAFQHVADAMFSKPIETTESADDAMSE